MQGIGMEDTKTFLSLWCIFFLLRWSLLPRKQTFFTAQKRSRPLVLRALFLCPGHGHAIVWLRSSISDHQMIGCFFHATLTGTRETVAIASHNHTSACRLCPANVRHGKQRSVWDVVEKQRLCGAPDCYHSGTWCSSFQHQCCCRPGGFLLVFSNEEKLPTPVGILILSSDCPIADARQPYHVAHYKRHAESDALLCISGGQLHSRACA